MEEPYHTSTIYIGKINRCTTAIYGQAVSVRDHLGLTFLTLGFPDASKAQIESVADALRAAFYGEKGREHVVEPAPAIEPPAIAAE